MNWKDRIILIIAMFLAVMLAVSTIKYNQLNKELLDLKLQTTEKIDSLIYANQQHLEVISELEDELSSLNDEIDSLEQVKNKIIIKKDEVIVSKDVSSGVELLKKNLSR